MPCSARAASRRVARAGSMRCRRRSALPPRGGSASPRARGSSFAHERSHAVLVEQAVAALRRRSPDRRRRAAGPARRSRAATASTIAALASMPVFVAWTSMSPATASICAVDEVGGQRSDAVDAARVLGGDRGDRARAVHAERGERLQVGLDAGAAARVAARNCQRCTHTLKSAVMHATRLRRRFVTTPRCSRPAAGPCAPIRSAPSCS